MQLKPQDVIVALKLSLSPKGTYAALSEGLLMPISVVHGSVRRLIAARLADEDGHVRRRVLRNFLVHGVPYAFPAVSKGISRGVRTAWAAPEFAKNIQHGDDDVMPVWPDPQGDVKGQAIEPLHPAASKAAKQDQSLYAALAAVDLLRVGRARERAMGEEYLDKVLSSA